MDPLSGGADPNLVSWKKGDRKLFIGVFVTECLTIFNPFVVKVLLDVFGFGTRFVRFLWIIVFFITIGYALTLLIFASAKTGVRILTGGICLVLIVTLGIPVFRGTEDFPYKRQPMRILLDRRFWIFPVLYIVKELSSQEY